MLWHKYPAQKIIIGNLRDINSTALHLQHSARTLLAENRANPKPMRAGPVPRHLDRGVRVFHS